MDKRIPKLNEQSFCEAGTLRMTKPEVKWLEAEKCYLVTYRLELIPKKAESE